MKGRETMTDFKVIDKNTDLSKAKYHKVPWDVVLSDGEAYDIYQFNGYVHTEGGRWGENCYYACPRGENPTAENLILFRANSTCRWGFTVTEHNYLKNKWGETYIEDNVVVTILRNDKPFKTILCRDLAYGTACALKFITEVQEGFCGVNEINWANGLIGRKVYYKNTPAVVMRVDTEDFRVYLVPDNDEKCFPKPVYWNDYTEEEWKADYGHGMYIEADSTDIHWFRDYNIHVNNENS